MMERLLLGCSAIGIQMMLAMSVNIISGYARQLSLGQAAFAALGAYTSALLNLRLGWSFWLACPLSVVLTGSIGGLLALPVLRVRKYYILTMTLIVGVIVQHVLHSGRFTGGSFGLGQIAPPQLLSVTLESEAFFPVVLAGLGVCGGVDCWFRRTWAGSLQHDVAGQTGRAVLAAFVVSAAMAGFAGSLFAHFEAFISPFDFNFEASLFILALAACGGLGSPIGAVIGALLLGGLLEVWRFLEPYRLLGTGVVLLLVGRWFPGGVLQLCTRVPNPWSDVHKFRAYEESLESGVNES